MLDRSRTEGEAEGPTFVNWPGAAGISEGSTSQRELLLGRSISLAIYHEIMLVGLGGVWALSL